ncbi:unnamed protein product, partial [Closterium sp. NIES-54]
MFCIPLPLPIPHVCQAEEYLMDSERLVELLDPALGSDYDLHEAQILCDIARSCVQELRAGEQQIPPLLMPHSISRPLPPFPPPLRTAQDRSADRPAIRDVAQALVEHLGRVVVMASSTASSEYSYGYSYDDYGSQQPFFSGSLPDTSGSYTGDSPGNPVAGGGANGGAGGKVGNGGTGDGFTFRNCQSQPIIIARAGGGVERSGEDGGGEGDGGAG